MREDASSRRERDQAVDELIELVAAVDGILQVQAEADADYFLRIAGRTFSARRSARDPRRGPGGVPLAVHRVGRAGTVQRRPRRHDQCSPGRARRRRPCAAHAIGEHAVVARLPELAWCYWAATVLALAAAAVWPAAVFAAVALGVVQSRPFLRARRADRRASGAGADRVPRPPARRALAAARGDPLAAARRDVGEGGLRILPARADAGAHALEPDAAVHAAARAAGVSDAPGPGQHPRGPSQPG